MEAEAEAALNPQMCAHAVAGPQGASTAQPALQPHTLPAAAHACLKATILIACPCPCGHTACTLQRIAEWEEKEEERQAAYSKIGGERAAALLEAGDEDAPQFVAYVPLPDQAAIEQRVLEKKKQDLLSKYTSDSLQQQQDEARSLLNKK